MYLNLSVESISSEQKVWTSILNIMQKNISKIVINDKNLLYILSKLINKAQEIKNNTSNYFQFKHLIKPAI
jgi:hypothetical protein